MPTVAAFFLILLPWLNPFAPGPTPAAVPLLFAWACAAVLLGSTCRVLPNRFLVDPLMPSVAWAWLVAGLLSSSMGLLQYFGAKDSFLPWMNQTGLGEAFANLRQRNQFASLTNIALLALVWLGVNGRFTGRRQWQGWLVAVLLATGNATSSSRTGLMQLSLLCALFWVWGGWHHILVRRIWLAAVLAYLIATLTLPWLVGFDPAAHGMFARFSNGGAVCASRLTLWSNVLHLIAQKPWFGWGWGELDYAHYLTLYSGERFCDILDNAHNLPLHLAVELGVPAAVLVCGMFTWLVLRVRPWREVDPTRQMAWGALAVIFLHSMLEYPLWYGPFQMAFGLCVLMLCRSPATQNSPQKAFEYRVTIPFFRIIQGQAAVVLLAFVSYAGWDYHRISQIYLEPEARDTAYREGTLEKTRESWLFADQVRFAELILTPLSPANAAWTYSTATALLHFSPEPRVIEKVIESAVMLDRGDEAGLQLARYRAAFPKDQARWATAQEADGKRP